MTLSTDTHPSIMHLPAIVTSLYQQVHIPLLPTSDPQAHVGLFVRYLRRKAERGLAVIYAVDELHHKHTHSPTRTVSLTLEEQALQGTHIRFTLADVQHATVQVQPTGVLQAASLGLSLQAFPADSHLTALAASCDTTPGQPLFAALQESARLQLHDDAWQLLTATAEPVRYKPTSRCVIRYHLTLHHPHTDPQELHLTIFGKVYADATQAHTVQSLQQQLYQEQAQQLIPPLLPRPLASIASLGLTFNEAIQPPPTSTTHADHLWSTLRTGVRALQPALERKRDGRILRTFLPEEELLLTAHALARLHLSSVQPPQQTPRTGAKEAKRALERAKLIAGWNTPQAEATLRLAQSLAQQLTASQPDRYRPAHGGFKASQLLFHSHRVFVVDFDGFCLADPALDVGYFLAYLRPSGLWYHKAGMRLWFEQAADFFRHAYRNALAAAGMDHSTIDGILMRSRLYEAALLFKIATRRVNRLNSPRPQELTAMLNEIATCIAGTTSGGA